jgi:hypothetical protein
MSDQEKKLPPQKIIISKLRARVDAWRGFELQNAKIPYPREIAKYKPVLPFENEISETTNLLLQYWFRPFPHESKNKEGKSYRFKYWPHQRRTIETFIYLREVCKVQKIQDISKIIDFEIVPQRCATGYWIGQNKNNEFGYCLELFKRCDRRRKTFGYWEAQRFDCAEPFCA